jgi:hypothetical protein
MGDDGHFVFRQKLLVEDERARRGVATVKQPDLFSPKFWNTSSHVFTKSPQNIAVEPGIHSFVCWDKLFVLPQLLYRWRHQSGIFWIPPRIYSDNAFTQSRSSLSNIKTRWNTKIVALSNLNHAGF